MRIKSIGAGKAGKVIGRYPNKTRKHDHCACVKCLDQKRRGTTDDKEAMRRLYA